MKEGEKKMGRCDETEEIRKCAWRRKGEGDEKMVEGRGF